MLDPSLNGTQPEDYIYQPTQNQPDEVLELQTLLGAHLSLIGERLQDISRNIYTHLRNGSQPNVDRTFDTLFDTTLYVSNILLYLLNEFLENPQSGAEIEEELTSLAVFHLSAPHIQAVNQRKNLHLLQKTPPPQQIQQVQRRVVQAPYGVQQVQVQQIQQVPQQIRYEHQ